MREGQTGSGSDRVLRGLGPVLAVALVLAVGGCGDTIHGTSGVLEVHNVFLSSEDIRGVDVEEVVGPNFLAFDERLHPGDTLVIDLFPSLYDVTVWWDDGAFDIFFDVDVRREQTTRVDALR